MAIRIGLDATPLPPRPVGAGNYIIHLIRSLAGLEHEFELVVFAYESGRILIGDHPLSSVEWVTFPDHSPARRLIWEQTSLPRLALQQRLDLLHSLHYTRPLRLPCRSVVTLHDMTFILFPELHTRSKRLFFPWMIRYSAWTADALAAVSENTRRDAIRLLDLDPERIFTTPNGIDTVYHPIEDPIARQECQTRYDLPEEFLLFVGLVEPRKNLPLLIRAYGELASRFPAPDLVVVGRLGWMYEDVFRQVQELGLKERVHFTGYVPAEDLPMVYNLAKVFIYPSRYEGFGFPPLEAMACGTPVITTAISAMQDQVGDAGLLVSPDDVAALSQAIERLLSDPDLRRVLSERGRQRAGEYTWTRTAQTTLQAYRWALNRSGTRS